MHAASRLPGDTVRNTTAAYMRIRNASDRADRLIGVRSPAADRAELHRTTIGDDGLGLVTYQDIGNDNLKVAHCIDTACTSATVRAVPSDSQDTVGLFSSVAFGVDGRALVAHHVEDPDYDLQVIHLPYGY